MVPVQIYIKQMLMHLLDCILTRVLLSAGFNIVLSESFCLDISSFCYTGSLTQVSGNGFPPTAHCKLVTLSSRACCGPDAVFLAQFWFCCVGHRWGWWWGSGQLHALCSGGQSASSTQLCAQVCGPAES